MKYCFLSTYKKNVEGTFSPRVSGRPFKKKRRFFYIFARFFLNGLPDTRGEKARYTFFFEVDEKQYFIEKKLASFDFRKPY